MPSDSDKSSAAWPKDGPIITMYGVGPGPIEPFPFPDPAVPAPCPFAPPIWSATTGTSITIDDTVPTGVAALRNILGQLKAWAKTADREEVAQAYLEAAALVEDHLESV